jgi:hypothetical protein
MLSKEQYNEVVKHKQALELFKTQGDWIGGDEVFYIHERITGQPSKACASCKGEKLIDLINMMRLYEERSM